MAGKILIGEIVTCILIVIGFAKKKSVYVCFIQCIWFWLLFGFNNGGVDYEDNLSIYLATYRIKKFSPIDGLQNITGYIANKAGLDYVSYNAIMGFLCVMILYYVIKNSSRTPAFAMSLFYIFLLGDSIIQKRFFIAMCFALLAFFFGIKKEYVKYFVLCIIAIGFHASMVLYLLFPIVVFLSRKKIQMIALFILIEIVGYRFMERLILLTPLASKYIEYTRIQRYSSLFVGICFLVLQLLFIFLILRIWNFWRCNDSNMSEIVMLNSASLLIVPLLLFGATWIRYFRVFQIFNFGFIGNRWLEQKDKRYESYWYMVCYVLLLIVSELVITMNSDIGLAGKIETIFGYNQLLQRIFIL